MRETKDQTIERLEKVIDNQKKELSEVKKDRKRLNYAVERLEREKKKALNTLTPTAINLISEYSDQVAETERKNEELVAIIADKERAIEQKEEQYKILSEKYIEKEKAAKAVSNQNWNEREKFKYETIKKTAEDIASTWEGMYSQSWDDRKRLKYFNDGKRYTMYGNDEDDDFEIPYICCPMFSTDTLIIRMNPNTGRGFEPMDHYALQYFLKYSYGTRIAYSEAIKELEEYKKNNPNISEEELVEWAYHKGMELLPLYRDKIF